MAPLSAGSEKPCCNLQAAPTRTGCRVSNLSGALRHGHWPSIHRPVRSPLPSTPFLAINDHFGVESGQPPLSLVTSAIREDWTLTLHVRAVSYLLSETGRSEEHTSELQSLMRISYAVFCLKKKHILDRTTLKVRTLHK